MILDYREYIKREGTKGLLNFNQIDNNTHLYNSKLGVCPFCTKKKSLLVYNESTTNYPNWLDGSFRESEKVWECQSCGWWEYCYTNQSNAMNEGLHLSDIKVHTAVLKKFELGDKSVPIQTLNDYISKNPEKIYDIHHKKMEELTKAVFEEHYNCEVELVGKSHDGGMDLILVNSDDPIVVQVKRRTQAKKVEPVSSIRELLGATQLFEAKSCIFVSTADHFSAPAIAAAEKAQQLELVNRFDLIDYHRFVDMLKLQQVKLLSPWETLTSVNKVNK